MSSLPEALKTLAEYRTHNTRASQDILEKGATILKSGNANSKLGDEVWPFLEQLFLAAIDVGKLDVADECLHLLSDKFPGSPRVDVLAGIRIEASEPAEFALKFYDDILNEDSANAAIWKRRISVLRRTGKVEKSVEELKEYLDTFYNDLEAWLELADIYSSCNQYTSALSSLSHVLLLAPQNPFYILQFAETAYTANDIPLAFKMFLVCIETAERDIEPKGRSTEEDSNDIASGIVTRAWYGVKLCTRILRSSHNPSSQSETAIPNRKRLDLMDQLATERILTAYSVGDGKGKQDVRAWLES
ncbi:tetratricopeptide repeat protein 35 [Moniliophthora roreri MCA 2997]|uniref:ER membrane protein complex subunit 2 n=1 Tax=Moniliophthora roreri (strain MCA 2997) TaxID=1381753 RepID=V2W914_MONRO|nr:tetratricopeptide repeat protein 35 [Moniliophthora roreri MCA 2997]